MSLQKLKITSPNKYKKSQHLEPMTFQLELQEDAHLEMKLLVIQIIYQGWQSKYLTIIW